MKVLCKVCEKKDEGTQDELGQKGWVGFDGKMNKLKFKFELCREHLAAAEDILDDIRKEAMLTEPLATKFAGKIMIFEIINPSDEAYIEGEFKHCCLATLFFGEGHYGLQQVDGDLKMPLFLFGSPDKWLIEQFGKNLEDLLKETSKEDIGKALLTVKLVRERSSLNDFTTYAQNLGKKLLESKVNLKVE